MPPADPAAVSAAVSTVRKPHLPVHMMSSDVSYQDACELLARELVRLLDAGEAVRVKGLVWDGNECYQWSDTVFGTLDTFELKEGGKFEYGIGDGNYHDCESLDDGKAKCKAHYRARLAAALEPLFAKEVGT